MDSDGIRARQEQPDAGAEPGRGSAFNARSTFFVVLCGVLAYLGFALFPPLAGPVESPAAVTGIVAPPAPPAPPAPEPYKPQSMPAAGASVPALAGPAAAPPQRLIYPAAEIDVPVHPLEPTGADQASQSIVPPPTTDGYWLVPYGMPGAGSVNTTYIAGHSWTDRDAPFNRLSTKAAAGDRLTVTTANGEVAYRVDSVTTYVKSGLKDSSIWAAVPNRLVLISCYTLDFWGTNVVVVASPEAETAMSQ